MNTPVRKEQTARSAASGERSVTLGSYRLFAKLGSGGMADVYLAVAHGAMNVHRLVVVKRLRDEQATDAVSREMFLNEARLAARLNHANVIQTFEAGSEGGSYYLAMEYVEGQPFSRVLTKLRQDGRKTDAKLAARVCADALNGLHYAHELRDFDGTPLRIVHRDVSPQNIMLTYAGVTKIVDFGIAKAAGSSQTAHGVFKGKVAYMAPEQVIGENVDGRADVFAAGIILWEAVTGKHLMATDAPATTLYNLMNKPIPRASEVCADVPAALDAIIAKALERDLDERYASAKAMRDALEGFLASAGGITTEEVGELVTGLFEDRRRTVQEQVKAQLAALSLSRTSTSSYGVSQTHLRTSATIIDLSDGTTTGLHPSMFRVVTTAGGLTPKTMAPPSRAPRGMSVAFSSVTALALAVSVLALYRSRGAPAAPPSPAPISAPAASPPPSPEKVDLAMPPPPAPPPSATTSAPAKTAVPHGAPALGGVNRPAIVVRQPTTPTATAPTITAPQVPPASADIRPVPTAAPSPPPKPTETATGRTFRRTL